jgi:regulator of replication initiation timing
MQTTEIAKLRAELTYAREQIEMLSRENTRLKIRNSQLEGVKSRGQTIGMCEEPWLLVERLDYHS